MTHKLSIISISFNNLHELKKTCSSVDKQLAVPYEHIIIDGSTNGKIKEWLDNAIAPSYRKWVCEKDNGISDAFNKGIRLSSGNLLLMLNSADELPDEQTLQKALQPFEKDKELMWLHGMYKYQRAGIWVVLGKPFDRDKLYRGMGSICHQTMYVKKGLYDKYGLYDTTLKIAMDFDFLVRIRNEKFLFFPEIIALFSPGGTSMQNMQQILSENTAILKKHVGISLKHKLWSKRLSLLISLINSPAGRTLYLIKVKLGLANK